MAAAILTITEPIPVTFKAIEVWVIGMALKRNGQVRYVVEDDYGWMWICKADEIGKSEGWMP